MCDTAEIENMSARSVRRPGVVAAAATLLAGMAAVVVVVAGTWALLYQPVFDPNPNGEVHVYYPGTRREITDFENYAIPGVIAALISCLAIQLARPLTSLRKKVVAASTGPTVLMLAAAAFLLLWVAPAGFQLYHVPLAVPFMTVVVTSALVSSAGFLAAIQLAQRVWLWKRE